MSDRPGTTWQRAPWPSLAAGAAVAALVAWALWSRWQFLSSSPFPLGVDGYFYPVQVRSLLDTGSLYYPSGPLTLWWLAPFAAVTDPVTGAKLGTAVGAALVAVPVYFLGKRLGGDRTIGVLAAVVVTTSASAFYMTSEFAKNCMGLSVAAGFLCALAWWSDRPSMRRGLVAGVSFLLVALAHKQAAAFAAVCAVAVVVAVARGRTAAWPRPRVIGVVAAGVVVIGLMGLLAAVLAPERFLAWRDMVALGAAFTADADWAVPALRISPNHTLSFGYEVAVAGALGVAALGVLAAARRWGALVDGVNAGSRALVVGPALLGILLAVPWLDARDANGLAFRLRVTAYLPVAMCLPFVVAAATRHMGAVTRGALVIGIAVGWLYSRPMTATEQGVVRVHPAMVTAVQSMRGLVPRDGVVIVPERQVMFMVSWYARVPARLSPGAVPAARRWRLVTFHYGGPALRRAMDAARTEAPQGIPAPVGVHPQGRNGLVLMPERTWEWVLSRLSPRDRSRYASWR